MTEDDKAAQGQLEGEPVELPENEQSEPGAEQAAKDETQAEKPAEHPAEDTEADKLARRAAKADALEKQIQYERRHHRRQMAELEKRQQERLSQPSGEDQPPQQYNGKDADDVEARVAKEIERREQAAKLSRWGDNGAKEVPDFNEKCNSVAELVGDRRGELMDVILDMDDGHKAIAHLADNPEEAMRIFDLPPRRMAIELGKLSAKGFAPRLTPQSAAPPPIKPLSGAGRAESDPDKMSMAEWVKWRDKQDSNTS